MVTDAALAIIAGYCLTRLSRSLTKGGAVAVFALATLAGMTLLVGLGTLLLMLDTYSVTVLLAGSAAVALTASVAADGRPSRTLERPESPARPELPVLLLLAVLALPLASPAYQIIAMGSDAGVYLNHAMQLEHDGRRFPAARVDPNQLPPALRDHYLADNRTAGGNQQALVEGLKVRSDATTLEYHALSGWPVVLSVTGRLLGMDNAQFVTVPLLMALGAFVLLTLRAMTASALTALLCGVATMTLPIVAYFARYPTVELVLAVSCAGGAWALVAGIRASGIVAGAAFATYALVHLSSFIPLLIACLAAPFLVASLEPPARRQLSLFFGIAGLAQLFALVAARLLSRGYLTDLLGLAFGRYQFGLWFIGGLASIAIATAIATAMLSRMRWARGG